MMALLGLLVTVVNVGLITILNPFIGKYYVPWYRMFFDPSSQRVGFILLGIEVFIGISLVIMKRTSVVGRALLLGALFTVLIPVAWFAFLIVWLRLFLTA